MYGTNTAYTLSNKMKDIQIIGGGQHLHLLKSWMAVLKYVPTVQYDFLWLSVGHDTQTITARHRKLELR